MGLARPLLPLMLEAEGYACGAAVLPACGVGAPHIETAIVVCGRRPMRGRRTTAIRLGRSGGSV